MFPRQAGAARDWPPARSLAAPSSQGGIGRGRRGYCAGSEFEGCSPGRLSPLRSRARGARHGREELEARGGPCPAPRRPLLSLCPLPFGGTQGPRRPRCGRTPPLPKPRVLVPLTTWEPV